MFSVSVGRRNETAENVQQVPNVTNVCMQPLHLYCPRSAFHSSFVISCKYDGFQFCCKQIVSSSEVQLVMSL